MNRVLFAFNQAARVGLAATALLFVSACSVLPQSQEVTLYRLPNNPSVQQSSEAGNLPPVIVRLPQSSGALSTSRILVVPPNSNEVSAYASVRWQDKTPIVLRDRLVDDMRSDGRFAAVSTDAALAGADFELGGDLNAFQVEHPEGQTVVHLRYDALFSDRANGKAVASKRFEIVEPVQGKDVAQVVEAFGRATDQLSQQVIKWVATQSK